MIMHMVNAKYTSNEAIYGFNEVGQIKMRQWVGQAISRRVGFPADAKLLWDGAFKVANPRSTALIM